MLACKPATSMQMRLLLCHLGQHQCRHKLVVQIVARICIAGVNTIHHLSQRQLLQRSLRARLSATAHTSAVAGVDAEPVLRRAAFRLQPTNAEVSTLCMQIPVFITSVMAVRRMASQHWPGFEAGGFLWFSNLNLAAVTWHPMDAPMGAVGIALPTAVAVGLLASLDQSFGRLQAGADSCHACI